MEDAGTGSDEDDDDCGWDGGMDALLTDCSRVVVGVR